MVHSQSTSERFQHRPAPGLREGGACLLLALGLAVAGPAPSRLEAQTATVQTEENFRAEPNGTVVARVEAGTVLAVDETRGDWILATLEGWVWTPSLQSTDQGAYDLRVSAEEGENLRGEPQGTVLARLEEGALLEELERIEGWIRVQRTAWIWAPSVRLDRDESGQTPEGAPTPPAELAREWRRRGSGPVPVLSGPDGDTLAVSRPGTELRVLGRQGNWARVRVEGWAWIPEGGDVAAADSAVLTDVSPGDVAANPGAYRGRVVAWELQYISREEAEQVRTDFYEGEPYLLTRPPDVTDRFVYVAVPPEGVDLTDSLTPLERIVVVGRIRTGSAALTGGPILDLLELSRSDGGS